VAQQPEEEENLDKQEHFKDKQEQSAGEEEATATMNVEEEPHSAWK
jgi:hypothetical protein